MELPSEMFQMYYMDLKNGGCGYKSYDAKVRASYDTQSAAYDDEKNFFVEVSNPAFSYSPIDNRLTITPAEYALLMQFAVTPFLPVAAGWNLKTPVYLEETAYTSEEYSAALTALSLKGLIRIDYDIPLSNFSYQAYQSYPMHGSMALTGAGQEIVEQLELQDVEQDETAQGAE